MRVVSELSMGWVNPRLGLGWVDILQFSVGWVEYDKSTILVVAFVAEPERK